MSYFHWIAGSILSIAWLSRLVGAALGMPKIPDISRPEWDRNPVRPTGNPRVSIIVPACNEEEAIEQALTRLLDIAYDNYEIIAVNDRSTDRTGEMLDRIAANAKDQGRMKVIHIATLPSGWLGKTHAMWTAARQAGGEWLLFTDADVLFKPDALRRALAYAEAEAADHVVLFPRLIMKSPGEKMMIAFFQTLFVFGHRPWKVADPDTRDHNLTKNFFAIMSFQWPRALSTCFALAFLNLMPFIGVGLAHGWERLPYAVALLTIFLIYVGMSWKSPVPPYYFLLHPISTTLFVYTMLRSMTLTLWRGGVVWRGTKYSLAELRKGMV